MARYLLAASPIPGHALPMLGIGAELVRRGHDVRLLTGAEFGALAVARGMRAVTLPGGVAASGSPDTRPGLVQRWRTGRAELLSVFVAPLVAQYAALRTELEREAAAAVLVDLAFTGALPLLLAGRPRPAVLVCGVGPLTVSSRDTAPFGAGWRPRAGARYSRMTWFTHRVLLREVRIRLDAALRAAGVAAAPVFLTDWPLLADRLLQLTVPAFEYRRRDLPDSVVFTGPLPVDDGMADWEPVPVRERRIRVHVTQGTWNNGDPGQLIVPTLAGLADRGDLEVIATTGRAQRLPIGTPGNARVVDFCSYAGLLPTVDVMVTNGGYGGVHAALAHGVPLVVAGGCADKPEVAARVAHFGVGVDLRTARPTGRQVAAAVDRVLTTPSYRQAAARVAGAIAATRPYDAIEQTLAEYAGLGPRPVTAVSHDDSPFRSTEEFL
ncbi:glycosyltransferase [Nocardia sp. alder85J]|uniref:glycosyltransferase n=1 Tax=Nocardia sp. alder85J TaxID=2862949 RepID=UPI001CD29E37|nr:nucleotide disphospho-sugar-binding domain-containing protein [Nocardia sp. alder85J]MCX4094712.1 glycosyltransferase [Nocardia sp. alder85J]